MSDVPTGTITFLFTDIEGSTALWDHDPVLMSRALARHDDIMRTAIEAHSGYIFKTMGDAFCAAFSTSIAALATCIAAQRALHSEDWSSIFGDQHLTIRARMALHTGAAEERDGDYFGQPLNRVARLMSAGHGGQILLSEVTHGLIRDNLPPLASVIDLGEHHLKDLYRPEHIYQVVIPDLPADFPPLRTLDTHPNNLPIQRSPIIGREAEISAIQALLLRQKTGLLTLTGPGGTGKTRLALQIGADLLDDFADGVFFVELAALSEHRLVISAIASTLGIKEAGSKPLQESLQDFLKGKELLLILDNFEHVVEAAGQVGQLLAGSANLKVLATSRTPLRIRGEKEYAVSLLSVPSLGDLPVREKRTRYVSQYEAVRLFVERATDVKADFQVTNDNAPAVAEICARLDGLPLAIELAAAWVRMLPPQALLARLSDRLKVLTGGARDLPARQQTLRNTLAWSYDLLDEVEQQLFCRMSVFQGGRTLEALEEVCNFDGLPAIDVLAGAGSLVTKSLLQQSEGRNGEPRFRMLETIHEYARWKLEESGAAGVLQKEHALYFMRLAEQADSYQKGPEETEWFWRLEDEHDNFRAALHWAESLGSQGDWLPIEIGLRIAVAMARFWDTRAYFSEGREHYAKLLALSAQYDGTAVQPQSTMARPQPQLWDSLRAQAFHGAAQLARTQGDYETSLFQQEQSLAIERKLGDMKRVAQSLNGIGLLAAARMDYATAQTTLEESLLIRRELGDKWGIGQALNNLGSLACLQRDFASARALYEESLAIRRELGHAGVIALVLGNLGIVAFETGDYPAARALFKESLALKREVADRWAMAICVGELGAVAAALGQAELGTKLLGATGALLESIGALMDLEDRRVYEQGIRSARSQLDDETWQKVWAEGRGMTIEQAVAFALEEAEDE